jgi:hypothetical protein
MEHLKIEHFQAERPGQPFPRFASLNRDAIDGLRAVLIARFSLTPGDGPWWLLKHIRARAVLLDGVNTEDDGFDLAYILHRCGVAAGDEAYINWYGLSKGVDRFRLADLAVYFADVWYPASDDIEIFDDSCSWVLFVDHGSYVWLARPDEGSGPVAGG